MKLDHIFLQPQDIERMKKFLVDVFSFELCDRPPFNFPGYWLGKNNTPLFHLAPGSGQIENTGVIGHIAISVEQEEDLLTALERAGVSYQVTQLPGQLVKQVFFQGPEGLTIEAVIYNHSAISPT